MIKIMMNPMFNDRFLKPQAPDNPLKLGRVCNHTCYGARLLQHY